MGGGNAETERCVGGGYGQTGAGLQGAKRSGDHEAELEQTTGHRDRLRPSHTKNDTLEKRSGDYGAKRLFSRTGRDDEKDRWV